MDRTTRAGWPLRLYPLLLALFAGVPTATAQPPRTGTTPTLEAMPPELRVAALPGRRTASAGGRSFCPANVTPLGNADMRVGRLRDLVDLRGAVAGNGTFALQPQKLASIARLACAHGSDPNAAAWLTSYRQFLVNATALEDEAIDALLVAALHQTDRTFQLACSGVPHTGPNQNPRERAFAELLTNLCTGSNRSRPMEENVYWLDGGAGLERHRTPNLLRAMWVHVAIDGNRYGRADLVKPEFAIDTAGREASVIAFFLDDLGRLDLAAARRELDTYGMTADEKAFATVVLARVVVSATTFQQVLTTAFADDATTRHVVLETARAATEAYRVAASANEARLRAAWDVEQAFVARDRAPMSGCAAAMRGHFLAFARSLSPRSSAAAKTVVDSALGYVLTAALYRCEAGFEPTGGDGRALALATILERAAVQRGPRVAAYNAVAREAEVTRAANPSFGMRVNIDGLFGMISGDYDWTGTTAGSSSRGVRGVVETATRTGDAVRVVFRHETYQQPIYQCTPTGRIARIERDGTVRYEEHCVVVGHEPVDVTAAPVLLPADMAAAVRPGAFLEALAGSDDDDAYPLLVRESAEGPELAWYGVELR